MGSLHVQKPSEQTTEVRVTRQQIEAGLSVLDDLMGKWRTEGDRVLSIVKIYTVMRELEPK
jgi:hypothetical protein